MVTMYKFVMKDSDSLTTSVVPVPDLYNIIVFTQGNLYSSISYFWKGMHVLESVAERAILHLLHAL